MYRDIAAKIEAYKEQIINSFIKRGIYPTDDIISSKIEEIDTSLAYLKSDKMISGEYFNDVVFNNMIKSTYKDLELLYNLLFQISVKEFTTLKAFIDTHLDALEDTANKYRIKGEQEAATTALGTTIYFQHSGFNIIDQNNVTMIDLGNIEVNNGSRIACFINASEIEASNILFGFQKAGEDEPIYATPYNYNQDTLLMPGSLEMTSYATTIADDHIVNGPIEMNLGANGADSNNKYIILGGKGKILVKRFAGSTSEFVLERPTYLNMTSFNARSYIDFYVVGGNQISFRFNKKPISTNFATDNYVVTKLEHIHHFFIECDAGFAFDFELDKGDVYAVMENGVVSNKKVYFSRSVDVKDFLVEEYKTGNKQAYASFVKIINDDGFPIEVNSVTIKELLSIGGDIV